MITALLMAAAAAGGADGATAGPPAAVTARYATDRVVCRAQATITGAPVRVCLTPRDWERRRTDEQQNIRLIQTRAYLIRR